MHSRIARYLIQGLLITNKYRIAGYFRGGNLHELTLFNVFAGKFSRIPQNTKRLLILVYYFALASPYGAELIIVINSSQLVKLLPFLLSNNTILLI